MSLFWGFGIALVLFLMGWGGRLVCDQFAFVDDRLDSGGDDF